MKKSAQFWNLPFPCCYAHLDVGADVEWLLDQEERLAKPPSAGEEFLLLHQGDLRIGFEERVAWWPPAFQSYEYSLPILDAMRICLVRVQPFDGEALAGWDPYNNLTAKALVLEAVGISDILQTPMVEFVAPETTLPSTNAEMAMPWSEIKKALLLASQCIVEGDVSFALASHNLKIIWLSREWALLRWWSADGFEDFTLLLELKDQTLKLLHTFESAVYRYLTYAIMHVNLTHSEFGPMLIKILNADRSRP